MSTRGLRILDVGDDYFHPAGDGWTWDWYFPVERANAAFESHEPVEEFRFWGRIAPAGTSIAPETRFPFPSSSTVQVIGVRTNGARGLGSHLRSLPAILTRGVAAVMRADVILFRWPSLHSMLLLPFAAAAGKTFVVRLRVDVEEGLPASGAIRSRKVARAIGDYTRWALRHASVPVCISRFLRDKYGNSTTVIFNECGVTDSDVDADVELARSRVVLYVGRLTPEKGVDNLIRAFAGLKDRDCRLEIVGGGSEGERLRMLAAELGVAQRVTFAGGISDRVELAKRYRSATVFALPSRSEGLGCVLLEAMATGTPIVATDVGGIPDLIRDGWNGALVAREDPVALAGAIDRLLADGGLRSTFARNGLEAVRQHTFEKQTGRWIELAVAAWRRRR